MTTNKRDILFLFIIKKITKKKQDIFYFYYVGTSNEERAL